MATPPPTTLTPHTSDDDGAAIATMISLPRLVSTCLDACRRGLIVIRTVQARREDAAAAAAALASSNDANGSSASGSAAKLLLERSSSHGVLYKVDGDPRSALTEADGASQEVILKCLRERWGDGLSIVGEEDDHGDDGDGLLAGAEDEEEVAGGEGGDVFERYGVPTVRSVPLREDLVGNDTNACTDNTSDTSDNDSNISTDMVPLSSVTIYVDPMDGTREFVEGRLANVQCLIGITVDGAPIAGVIGLPFPPPPPSPSSSPANGTANGTADGMHGNGAGGGEVDDDGRRDDAPTMQLIYGIAPPPAAADGGDGGSDAEATHEIQGSWTRALGRLACSSSDEANVFTPLPFLLRPPLDDSEEHRQSKSKEEQRRLVVLTGDSQKADKALALDHLAEICSEEGIEMETVIAGGCGNKMLRAATIGASGEGGGDALAVMPKGTSSWDTAAPTAVLRAALAGEFGSCAGTRTPSGAVTDLYGGPIRYDGLHLTNDDGVLAGAGGAVAERCHRELCRRMAMDR